MICALLTADLAPQVFANYILSANQREFNMIYPLMTADFSTPQISANYILSANSIRTNQREISLSQRESA
jgi:hypothetical protein